jgi:hypothetical protein
MSQLTQFTPFVVIHFIPAGLIPKCFSFCFQLPQVVTVSNVIFPRYCWLSWHFERRRDRVLNFTDEFVGYQTWSRTYLLLDGGSHFPWIRSVRLLIFPSYFFPVRGRTPSIAQFNAILAGRAFRAIIRAAIFFVGSGDPLFYRECSGDFRALSSAAGRLRPEMTRTSTIHKSVVLVHVHSDSHARLRRSNERFSNKWEWQFSMSSEQNRPNPA